MHGSGSSGAAPRRPSAANDLGNDVCRDLLTLIGWSLQDGERRDGCRIWENELLLDQTRPRQSGNCGLCQLPFEEDRLLITSARCFRLQRTSAPQKSFRVRGRGDGTQPRGSRKTLEIGRTADRARSISSSRCRVARLVGKSSAESLGEGFVAKGLLRRGSRGSATGVLSIRSQSRR